MGTEINHALKQVNGSRLYFEDHLFPVWEQPHHSQILHVTEVSQTAIMESFP